MSHLEPDRFALIAIGEEPIEDERHHLDVCDECAVELAQLEHTVSIGRSTVALNDLESPPERVWDAVLSDVRALREEEVRAAAASPAAPEPAVSEPPALRRTRTRPRRRSRATPLMFALAASLAVVLAVVGVTGLLRPASVVQLASATLDAFPDHQGAAGSAVVIELADGEREVEVTLDASVPDDGFREVWLITADASALVSLGTLEGNTGTFPIPAGIDIRDYVLVDISQETVDGDPAHSGDSIVRGELTFA